MIDSLTADTLRKEPLPLDSLPQQEQTYLRRSTRPVIRASTLYRPGPSNNMAKCPVRNAGANSCHSVFALLHPRMHPPGQQTKKPGNEPPPPRNVHDVPAFLQPHVNLPGRLLHRRYPELHG